MHLPRAAWQVTTQIQCCLCHGILTSNLDECVWHDTMSRCVQPHCITGHAVPFCRNMWEFTLRRRNNKGRSPPAVDCATDGYLWRGVMVRCARPLIATFASHKWLPVVSACTVYTASCDSAYVFSAGNGPGCCQSWSADWEALLQRISTIAVRPLILCVGTKFDPLLQATPCKCQFPCALCFPRKVCRCGTTDIHLTENTGSKRHYCYLQHCTCVRAIYAQLCSYVPRQQITRLSNVKTQAGETDALRAGFGSDADASWLHNRKLLYRLNNSSFQRKANLADQSSLA
jgi:hypothetical protein